MCVCIGDDIKCGKDASMGIGSDVKLGVVEDIGTVFTWKGLMFHVTNPPNFGFYTNDTK